LQILVSFGAKLQAQAEYVAIGKSDESVA